MTKKINDFDLHFQCLDDVFVVLWQLNIVGLNIAFFVVLVTHEFVEVVFVDA